MAYRAEAISSVEVGLPLSRHLHFNKSTNDGLKKYELDFLEEMRDNTQVKFASYKQKNGLLLQ